MVGQAVDARHGGVALQVGRQRGGARLGEAQDVEGRQLAPHGRLRCWGAVGERLEGGGSGRQRVAGHGGGRWRQWLVGGGDVAILVLSRARRRRQRAAAALSLSRARREEPGEHVDGVRPLEAEARGGAADAADLGPQVREERHRGVESSCEDVVQGPHSQSKRPGDEQRQAVVERQYRPKGRKQQRGGQAAARRDRSTGGDAPAGVSVSDAAVGDVAGGGIDSAAAAALALAAEALIGLHCVEAREMHNARL